MWWVEDWMACSQSLLVLSCVSGGRGLNNAEYTFGNKIIVTRLTDNNRCEISTELLMPRIMKGAHCGDRGVSGFIWNGIWNLHCQVLLASLHDKLEFLEKAAVSANLGVWNILSSYSHILSISLPNSTQQCFCYTKFLSKSESCVSNPGTYFFLRRVRMNELDIEFIWVNLSCSLSVSAGYKWCLCSSCDPWLICPEVIGVRWKRGRCRILNALPEK